jgi:hypothetical protein
MTLQTLSTFLWHERDLLDQLLYRLQVERLVLDAGLADRLPMATRDVENSLARMRTAELGRATAVDDVIRDLGLPPEATLAQIADRADSPWQGLLREHREALVALTAAVRDAAHDNQEVLAAAHHAAQETLMSLQESLGTYDEHGASQTPPSAAQIVDTSI